MKRYVVFVLLFILVFAATVEAQIPYPWRRYFRLPAETRGLPQRIADLEARTTLAENRVTDLEADLAIAKGKITDLETENVDLKDRVTALEEGSVNTEFETLMVLGAMSAAIIGVEAGQLLHADMMEMVNAYTPGVSVVTINGERTDWTQELEVYWQSRADTFEIGYGYVMDYTTEYRDKVGSLSGQDYQTLRTKLRAMIGEAVDNFDALLMPDE